MWKSGDRSNILQVTVLLHSSSHHSGVHLERISRIYNQWIFRLDRVLHDPELIHLIEIVYVSDALLQTDPPLDRITTVRRDQPASSCVTLQSIL